VTQHQSFALTKVYLKKIVKVTLLFIPLIPTIFSLNRPIFENFSLNNAFARKTLISLGKSSCNVRKTRILWGMPSFLSSSLTFEEIFSKWSLIFHIVMQGKSSYSPSSKCSFFRNWEGPRKIFEFHDRLFLIYETTIFDRSFLNLSAHTLQRNRNTASIIFDNNEIRQL